MARPYRRLLTPDGDGGYIASIHEFPGCVGDGPTADEALRNLDAAARDWVDAAITTGYPIPLPAVYDDFSGKVALRISRRLHKMAAERAAVEGTSVNQLLSAAIALYLGQSDGLTKAVAELRSACSSMLAPPSTSHNFFILASPHGGASSSQVVVQQLPNDNWTTTVPHLKHLLVTNV